MGLETRKKKKNTELQMEGVKLVGLDRCASNLAHARYLAYSWFSTC